MSTATDRLRQARTTLVLDHPFYGSLSLKLTLREGGCDTMATDGTSLFYAPEFVDKCSDAELVGLMAHEVMHCALGHHVRREGRDPGQWNEAADFAENPILLDAGFTLPEGGLVDYSYKGLTAEQIFGRLPEKQPGDEPAPGEVRDAPEPAESEAEWKVNVTQAAMTAKRMGVDPGTFAQVLEAAKKQPSDWRAHTRRFMQQVAAADYSWRVPNRRYMASGIILPSLRSVTMGPVVVMLDTSGSTGPYQSGFVTELQSIVDEVQPECVYVIECDAAVHRVQRFEAGDIITLDGGLRGQGGTDFCPAFDKVTEMDIAPACAIYLTDGDGRFPTEPDYPVLWAITPQGSDAPFGENIRLED